MVCVVICEFLYTQRCPLQNKVMEIACLEPCPTLSLGEKINTLKYEVPLQLTCCQYLSCIGANGHQNYLESYNGGYTTVDSYLEQTGMANNGTWGTDFEIGILAHLLQTVIYSFKAGEFWLAMFPGSVNRTIPEDVYGKSMYIILHRESF